jgi:hypothetical protein
MTPAAGLASNGDVYKQRQQYWNKTLMVLDCDNNDSNVAIENNWKDEKTKATPKQTKPQNKQNAEIAETNTARTDKNVKLLEKILAQVFSLFA